MRRLRYVLIPLLLCALTTLMPGWATREAGAAAAEKVSVSSEEIEGHGEGFQPEGKEEAREEAKGDECPATFGPIITDTAIPIEKGKFALQPTFALSLVTDTFNKDWRRVSAGGNFQSFNMSWKFTYGLINNLEVYLVIPYIHNWASDVAEPGPRGERNSNFGGLGDVSFTLKYRLVEETETLPTVSAIFTPSFPTGHFRHLNPSRLGVDAIGGGSYIFTTGFNVSKYLKPFILYGNLWYSMQTAYTSDEGRVYPRDFVTVNLAAEYPITKKWVALLELTSFWDAGRLFGLKANTPPGALVSILPGIEYMATDKFSLALGVNVDLAGKNTDANVTPILSMVYAF
jgi:Putative MetA-pathway of phenol degradation